MDITAHITGVIARFGYFDNNVYKPDPDCFYSISELIRFLRSDDSEFTVRKAILAQNPMKNDLLRILMLPDVDDKLFDAALRLIINLMTPAYVLADVREFDDKTVISSSLRVIDDALHHSSSSFANENLFKMILTKVEALTAKSTDDITEEEKVKLERYFMLVRQIFYVDSESIPTFAVEKRDRKVQDRVISCYLKSGLHRELLRFAVVQRQKEYLLPVFSVTTLIVSRFDPIRVASAADNTITKKKLTETEERVYSKMVANSRPQRPSGRPFLGGTYSVHGMKAINSDRNFVVLKPIENHDIMNTFNDRKGTKAIAKNRRITNAAQTDMITVPESLLFEVKKFVLDMLDGLCRKMIKYVIDVVFDSTKHGLNKFTDRFFFALNIFMFKFCKAAKICDFQKSLYFHKEFVHMVLTRIEYYFDSMKMEKEHLKQHVKGAEYAIGCFEAVLIFLKFMGDNLLEENEDFYKDIIAYLFEMQESREMTGNIMFSLKPTQVSMPMLHSLIILNEYFMFLMEKESKRGRLAQIKTNRKRKAQPRPKKKKDRDPATRRLEKDLVAYSKKYTSEELDEVWKTVSIDLEDIISGVVEEREEPDIYIIDFALDVEDPKDRQLYAILKVRRALREGRAAEAIEYYKAGQAFWSNEGDAFADELKIGTLKELMYLDTMDGAVSSFRKAVNELVLEKQDNAEGAKEGSEKEENFDVTDFNLVPFVSKLANVRVLNWYFFVFQTYQTNPEHVNMAILKFFQRIWRELDDPVRLYDVRLFYVFDEIGKHCKSMSQNEMKLNKYNLLYTFAEKFTAEFFVQFAEKGSILINDLWT